MRDFEEQLHFQIINHIENVTSWNAISNFLLSMKHMVAVWIKNQTGEKVELLDSYNSKSENK